MSLGKVSVVIAITIILLITVSVAEASPTVPPKRMYVKASDYTYGNFITVELAPTCLRLAKLNASSLCPTYSDLEAFDTTNKKTAGKFSFDGLYYHRGEPLYKNYQFSYPVHKYPLVVCVDCSENIIKSSKIIFVKSSGDFKYVLKSQHKLINFTRYENEARYIDDCFVATIAWSPTLLNDTIHFMNSGCKGNMTKAVGFNETKSILMKPSKLTYDGQWYQHLKFLEQAKKDAQKRAEEYCKKQGSKC